MQKDVPLASFLSDVAMTWQKSTRKQRSGADDRAPRPWTWTMMAVARACRGSLSSLTTTGHPTYIRTEPDGRDAVIPPGSPNAGYRRRSAPEPAHARCDDGRHTSSMCGRSCCAAGTHPPPPGPRPAPSSPCHANLHLHVNTCRIQSSRL